MTPEGETAPATYWHSIIALILTIMALGMVWLRERGLTDMALRKEEFLNKLAIDKETLLRRETNEMESRLTSLPPRQFMNDYVETLRIIGELRRLTKNESASLDADTIVKRIQTMMYSVLSLARTWDDVSASNKFLTYHANIMRVLPADGIDVIPVTASDLNEPSTRANDGAAEANAAATYKRELEDWVLQFEFFLHNQSYDVALQRCTGILFIQDTGLSVESQHPEQPDENVEEICLPFTLRSEFKHGFHHPNLPGAPQAAATGQPIYIANMQSAVREWLDEEKIRDREVSPRYEEQITRYYQNLEHAKSLISLPIYHGEELKGVLNVSRGMEDMLRTKDRAELFVQLMNPICYHFGKMLSSLEDTDTI